MTRRIVPPPPTGDIVILRVGSHERRLKQLLGVIFLTLFTGAMALPS